MAPLAHQPYGGHNPNSTLEEVSEIKQGIDGIHRNLEQLRMLQQRALDEVDSSGSSSTSRQLDNLSSQTMAEYRSLTERVRMLKSNPQNSRYGQQVGNVDRSLKDAIKAYQQVEAAYRKRTGQQLARQYKIVQPDASEAEINAVVEGGAGGQQIFQQAMMQGSRTRQAQSVLNAVQDRHAQLEKISQQMLELTQLMQDLDTMVVQQQETIEYIEQKGEEVTDNLDKGNVEIGTAINTARATRKKKWICLGICVAIILIVVIIVVIYVEVTKGSGNKSKRSLPDLNVRSLIESEPVSQLLTSRINAETRRWLMSTTT
ncbi:t-SNARE [Xylariaceae sp. FL0255]|nr:t-SNARE [Xylariaceae sp. FL0255]